MGDTTSIHITSNDNEGIQCILDSLNSQNGINVIGVESDVTHTIINSARLKPDVLILDLVTPLTDEAELAPIIHRRSPDTAIIMICDKDENEFAGKALSAGILGFLIKNTDMDKILHAVKIVSLGGYFISASIIKRAFASGMANHTLAPGRANHTLAPGRANHSKKEKYRFLSPVERCIISEIALGFPDEEIADHINYSAGSVKNRITAIKRKTKLKTRAEIAVFSLINGFISPEQAVFMKEKSDRQLTNNTIE